MSSLIPRTFIEDLLARVDIVEIIGSRIKLRKAGSNYVASCPFHTEKTPSFSVNPKKQFYYCFGCGAHGNAIGFLMEFDRLDFIDAVETLAAQIGLEVPHENQSKSPEISHQESFAVLSKVKNYYQKQLVASKAAKDYLQSRGLTGEIVNRYQLGYAPPEWEHLAKKIEKKSAECSLLITNGILIAKENDGKLFDRFRDRIMFPIHDQRGRVIGFGGRTISNDTPKYLNSPETPVFHKGQELYGLYEAKQANRTLPYLLVVEGYMDVIALAQHGISCAVAVLGTAITIKHIQKLFRATSRIVFCFDGDSAGKKAAWLALELALPLMHDGLQASFLFLPETQDPDSQIRKEGKKAFIERIRKEAVPLSEFFFLNLTAGLDLTTADNQAEIAKKAGQLLEAIPRGVFQELMYHKLSALVSLSPEKLRAINGNHNEKPSINSHHSPNKLPALVSTAIKILLHQPELITSIEDISILDRISMPGINLLVSLCQILQANPSITTGAVLEHWRGQPEEHLLAELALSPPIISNKDLKNELIATIKRIAEYYYENSIKELLNKKNLSLEDKQKLQNLIKNAKLTRIS